MKKHLETNSGYHNPKLTFSTQAPQRPRTRRRNIIWFNPPYNKNVSTNIAKSFLNLIDKHFTKENNLQKLFNRNNVKVSYSCTENVGTIIKSHNKKVSSPTTKETPAYNCRNKNTCPLDGKCRTQSVIYKCEVTTPNLPKTSYIGLTEKDFKTRYNGHNQSFTNHKYKNSTTLSTYIWELKDQNIEAILNWSIIKHAKSYTNKSKNCPLCLHEKLEIMSYKNKTELLNKRSEMISKCRHSNKFLLTNYKTKE